MAPNQTESNPNHSSSSSKEEDDKKEEAIASQSESQKGSDSDSSQSKQTPAQKASISKPTNSSQKPTESGSDAESVADSGNVVPAKKSKKKRPAAVVEKGPVAEVKKRPAEVAVVEVKKKKSRKEGGGDGDDEGKKQQLFQRLWSEDDEIVILKGMIDFKKQNGVSHVNEMGAFHEFIKKSLDYVDASQTQLVDKVRRLKRRYDNKEKNGKDRKISKSHEQKVYKLSKLIWGGMESNTKAVVASNVVKLNGGIDVNRFVRYDRNDGPILVEEVVKARMELVKGSKRKELEDKWNELKREELLLYVKRMDFVKEQASALLDSSEN